MTAGGVPAVGRESAAGPDGSDGEVLRLFEAKAAGWAAKYAQDGPLTGRLASLSAAVSWHARAGNLVLDLGCGTGELARALAADGLMVTGCDISPQMLLRAACDPTGRVPGAPGGCGWSRAGGACRSRPERLTWWWPRACLNTWPSPPRCCASAPGCCVQAVLSCTRCPICGIQSGGWSGVPSGWSG